MDVDGNALGPLTRAIGERAALAAAAGSHLPAAAGVPVQEVAAAPARQGASQRAVGWLVGRYERAPLGTVAVSLALFCATLVPLIGVWPAVGLGALVLVHETAHWLGFRLFRIWATAPIFIPYVGGLVVTRTRPRTRRAYAWCILAGPVAGIVATHVVLTMAVASHSWTLVSIARLAGLVNFANLLPIPGLDGWLVWRASRTPGGRARVWPRLAWVIVLYEAWVVWAAASGH